MYEMNEICFTKFQLSSDPSGTIIYEFNYFWSNLVGEGFSIVGITVLFVEEMLITDNSFTNKAIYWRDEGVLQIWYVEPPDPPPSIQVNKTTLHNFTLVIFTRATSQGILLRSG